LRIWFDHAAGLNAKGAALTGFEVAGIDAQYRPANAHIDGETVVVDSKDIAQPMRVRYGWANSPDCNLFNKEGLPASPFQSSLQVQN
jgi:sialate O-acetylesterase